MEYKNGMVNNIPIQRANIPNITNKIETINNAKIINGCFATNLTLIAIASNAFKFEKIINGIVRIVKSETTRETTFPINGTPKNSRTFPTPDPIKVTDDADINNSLK